MRTENRDAVVRNLSRVVRRVGAPLNADVPIVAFGEAIYHAGGGYGPQRQKFFQFLAVLEGSAQVEAAGQTLHIRAGEVGLLSPQRREWQRFSAKRKTHHFWCSLHPSLLFGALAEACRKAAGKVLPLSRRMEQLMELGLSMPRRESACMHDLLEALGMAVLREFFFTDERMQQHEHDVPDALRRALEWIEVEGSARSISLVQVAQEAGVSRWWLVKLFRRHLDMTPMHYLWKTRTRHGVQILRETSLSVAETAYKAGFQTPQHFTRLLRQHYGVSPRQLRAYDWQKKRTLPPALRDLPLRLNPKTNGDDFTALMITKKRV